MTRTGQAVEYRLPSPPVTSVVNRHAGARSGEEARRGCADSFTAARYECAFAAEIDCYHNTNVTGGDILFSSAGRIRSPLHRQLCGFSSFW